MNNTSENDYIKEDKPILDMASQFVVGVAIIILLVAFVIPTVDTLSVAVSIPPDQNTVNVIPSRITLYQEWTLNPLKVSQGNVEVRITLQRLSGGQDFIESYYVTQGNWVINTYQTISKGDVVIVEVTGYGFKKVIPIV